MGIAAFFVKSQRIRIFRSNNGIDQPVALGFQDFFQGFQQLFTDATAPDFGQQVQGILSAPGVGRPLKRSAAIGVTQDFSVLFPYQPGELFGQIPKPGQEFFFRGNGVFK